MIIPKWTYASFNINLKNIPSPVFFIENGKKGIMWDIPDLDIFEIFHIDPENKFHFTIQDESLMVDIYTRLKEVHCEDDEWKFGFLLKLSIAKDFLFILCKTGFDIQWFFKNLLPDFILETVEFVKFVEA